MRLVIAFILLTVTSLLSATDYYVKNGGNDSNSGLDDANAWAHHPWMSTWTGRVTLEPGDVVYMKRGDKWICANPVDDFITVQQSGTQGKPIKTTSYGQGEKPIISISTNSNFCVIQGNTQSYISIDNLEISHWSPLIDQSSNKCGIQFGGYESNIPHDWVITSCDIHNCPKIGISGYGDSYNIVIGDINATTCATPTSYSNQIYNCGYAGILLGGCNYLTQNSNFQVYHNYIHDINVLGSLGQNAYGCAVSASSNASGLPRYVTMRYNYVSDVPTWEGLDAHGGRYIYFLDNYIKNCHFGINVQAAIISSHTPVLDQIFIEGNTIEANASLDARYFILIQGNRDDYQPKNINILNNTLFFSTRSRDISSYGIKLGASDGVLVEGNKIYNGNIDASGGAIQVVRTKNAIIRRNFFLDWFGSIYLETSSINGKIDIYNNIMYMSSGFGEPIWAATGITKGDINIFNNIILAGENTTVPTLADFSRMTIGSGTALVFRNNIAGFSSTDLEGMYIRAPQSISGTFRCDYNLYWNSSKARPFWVQDSYYDWSEWNDRGYDEHSLVNTDPQMVNTSNRFQNVNDYILKSTSPAINKGVEITDLIDDFFGNPRNDRPDIGAIEYTVSNQNVKITSITVLGNDGITSITKDNGTLQLNVTISPSNATNKNVTWSISNGTGQATINSSGLVTAIANGTVTARATAADGSGVSGSLLLTISNQIIPVTGITVTGSNGITSISTDNGTLQLGVTISPSNATNKNVTWSISNGTGQATINSSGLVTAIANGTVSAKATAMDGTGIFGTMAISISNQANIVNPVIISSLIENSSPSVIKIHFNLDLSVNIIPVTSSFKVFVNSIERALDKVSISGSILSLILTKPVVYGDIVTLTYTKPEINPLQLLNGTHIEPINNQQIVNNVIKLNSAPVIDLKYSPSFFSGFIGEIDASGSYDSDNDALIYSWSIPDGVSVSSISTPVIRFLAPTVINSEVLEISVSISDGTTKVSKDFSIEIIQYRPDLESAEVLNVYASDYSLNNFPFNLIDGNIGTSWSVYGENQWVLFELNEPFNINHIEVAFDPNQKHEFYLEVFGSNDSISWEPLLIKAKSCDFSGDIQVFKLPEAKADKAYKFIKYVGFGNSTDSRNTLSEFRILGKRIKTIVDFEKQPVKIYPNPAKSFINIKIDDPTLLFDQLNIVGISGICFLQEKIDSESRVLNIPIDLEPGMYLIQMGLSNIIQYSHKLIVIR